jgi:hypothetical protein
MATSVLVVASYGAVRPSALLFGLCSACTATCFIGAFSGIDQEARYSERVRSRLHEEVGKNVSRLATDLFLLL